MQDVNNLLRRSKYLSCFLVASLVFSPYTALAKSKVKVEYGKNGEVLVNRSETVSSSIDVSDKASNAKSGSPTLSASHSGVNASLTKDKTSLNYDNDKFKAEASLGLGYDSYYDNINHDKISGLYKIAINVFDSGALGLNYQSFADADDVTLIGVYSLKTVPVYIKMAIDYMWGSQDFNYVSGKENNKLNQKSIYLSSMYNFSETYSRYLQSVGFSAWGSKASGNQLSNKYYKVLDNNIAYITNENRHLAFGKLYGLSFDSQIAPFDFMVLESSLGYERLSFDKFDNNTEVDHDLYYAIKMNLEARKNLMLLADYRRGSSEYRLTLGAAVNGFALEAYKNWGLNGLSNNKGVSLSYTYSPFEDDDNISLAKRMRSKVFNMQRMMSDAISRPSELPQSFLAKADGVSSLIASIDNSLINGSDIVVDGDNIMITLAPGQYSILSAMVENSPRGNYSVDILPDSLVGNVLRLNISNLLLNNLQNEGDYVFVIRLLGADNNITTIRIDGVSVVGSLGNV